LHLRTEIKR